MDVPARLPDGLQHGLVRAGAIRQQPHPIARHQRRATDRLLHGQVPRQEIVFGCLRIRRNTLPAAIAVAGSIGGQARLRGARLTLLCIRNAGARAQQRCGAG
ncbi:hypothetical protein D3C72_1990080 [compost metagenome]